MKRQGILVLLIFMCCTTAFSQTAGQLIDSARFYKNKDYLKVISFAGAARKMAMSKGQLKLTGESELLLGTGNYLAGNYKEALHWYFEAEGIYTKTDDKAGLADLYDEMCIFYLKTKILPAADNVSKKAIAYSIIIKDPDKLATSINNRGLMFTDEGKTDSAIRCFRASYLLYKTLHDKIGMAYSLDYLSSELSEKGAYTEALKAMNESKQLRAGTGDKTGEAIAVNNIGELYLKEKKPAQAVPFFIDAIARAHALKYPDLEVYGYSMLAQTYQQQGKFREALAAQNKYVELNQQFQDRKNTRALQELQTRYETNKKEQQNKILSEQNKIQEIKLSRNLIGIYALLAITVMMGVVFYLLYNKYKLKQQARFKEAMLEEERLRAQGIMDAEENERQRLARELHDGVGQLLCAARRQVENTQLNDDEGAGEKALKMLDESIKEVRDMSHSMMPPSMLNKTLQQAVEEFIGRMNNNGALTIHTAWVNADDLELDKTTTLMLYRSMQEIITNIFRHAKATTVDIELVNHNSSLTLMVYDNGVGFDKEKLQRDGRGIGLKNIESRIAYIGGSLQIDTMPLKGVTYIIELPLAS
jgi:two-component system NarL family sensor kinase